MRSYPVLDPVSQAYPEVQGRSPTCYSPVRHSSTPASWSLSVRLACVKHAASVRPEPGSNSPQKIVRHQSPKEPDTQQKNYQTNQPPQSTRKNQGLAKTNIGTLLSSHTSQPLMRLRQAIACPAMRIKFCLPVTPETAPFVRLCGV